MAAAGGVSLQLDTGRRTMFTFSGQGTRGRTRARADAARGSVRGFSLTAGEGRQRLQVEFAASGHEGHFRLRQGRTSLERAQPQRRPDETEVLSRELGRL